MGGGWSVDEALHQALGNNVSRQRPQQHNAHGQQGQAIQAQLGVAEVLHLQQHAPPRRRSRKRQQALKNEGYAKCQPQEVQTEDQRVGVTWLVFMPLRKSDSPSSTTMSPLLAKLLL